MGRTLYERPDRSVRGTPRESGCHDELGAACIDGGDSRRFGASKAGHQVAGSSTTRGWLLAVTIRQRSLLWLRDAGLPVVQDVLPGLGTGPRSLRSITVVRLINSGNLL